MQKIQAAEDDKKAYRRGDKLSEKAEDIAGQQDVQQEYIQVCDLKSSG